QHQQDEQRQREGADQQRLDELALGVGATLRQPCGDGTGGGAAHARWGGERHQYTSRTRLTSPSLAMFSSRVMKNRRSPTKYRLWKARLSPATWSLPKPSAAIAAVIVWPGSSGSQLRRPPPTAPAAMATTIVSPIAREMPRISAATTPEMAAGNTTRKVVWSRSAPSP